MVWLVVHGILIMFSISMWKLWVLKINCFGKTVEFGNFEAVEDNNIDEIDVVEEHINDVDFTDNEIKYDENIRIILPLQMQQDRWRHYARFFYWFWLFSGSK